MKTFLSFIALSIFSTASFATSLVRPVQHSEESKAIVSVIESDLLEVAIEGDAAKMLYTSMQVDAYKSYGATGSSLSFIKETSTMNCIETVQKDNSLKYNCKLYPDLK